MFSYEDGVFVAFLCWSWISIAAVIAINSRMERNLNKIGQRLSWLTMNIKTISQNDAHRTFIGKFLKFVLIYGLGLPFVLTSWLYVVYVVGLLIYRKSKDSGAPQAVREFRWKLRNKDMTFDELVKELMKVSDKDLSEFEQFRAKIVSEMQEQGLRAG